MWLLTPPTSLPPEQGGWHWDVGHATSSNLWSWEYRGIVLQRGWGDAWEGQKLATGSVLKRDGLYWMAHTGHRKLEESSDPIPVVGTPEGIKQR